MYDMSSVWPKDIQEAKEHLQEHITNALEKCYFTIKLENKCIGQLGFDFSTPGKLWVCYWIANDYQKKGYMTEICPPMVKFFFETCEEFSKLHIRVHKKNTSSQKLANKICSFINQNNIYIPDTYEETIQPYSEKDRGFISYQVVHFKLFKNHKDEEYEK